MLSSRNVMWMGMVAIIIIGLIHLAQASAEMAETRYLGLMFIANGIAAVVVAAGIYRGAALWGWGLGALIAAGAFVGYVISRTVGLPGMEVEQWLQPLGILSLVVELIFMALFVWARPMRRTVTASR